MRSLLLATTLAGTCAAAAAAAALPAQEREQQGQQQQRADSAKGEKKKRKKADGVAKAAGDSARTKEKVPRPLFTSDAPLALTLAADFGALSRDRDTLKVRRHPGTLTFTDERGAPLKLDVQLSTRGHFRLKATTCSFPPLRVAFDRSKTKGTLFAGQRALKLVTHCRSGDRAYEQYVLREYLAYKAYNAITEQSFRNRLVRVTYEDTKRPGNGVTAYAYFLESEDELADRLDGRVLTARSGRFEDFDPEQIDRLAVFEYFAGNTDWSLGALHNIRIVSTSNGRYIAVPYDFDWSGIVDTRYAVPDSRLPIKTVRERLYRGPCRTAKDLAPTFDLFRARRDSITALYRGLRDLDAGYVKDTERYIAEFYETIGNPSRWRNAGERVCAETN